MIKEEFLIPPTAEIKAKYCELGPRSSHQLVIKVLSHAICPFPAKKKPYLYDIGKEQARREYFCTGGDIDAKDLLLRLEVSADGIGEVGGS
jgi:hypothetical protein